MTQGTPESPEIDGDFLNEVPTPPLPGPRLGDILAERRERARARLAGVLVGLLVVLDAAILILAVAKIRPLDHDLLAVLMAGVINPVVALVGTVLGFYFGEKAGKNAT